MGTSQISAFGWAFLFIVGGIVFVVLGLWVASLLRPARPNVEKLSAYECGEEAVGPAWGPFHNRYYRVALVFILFEVEIVLLFPWAVVFGQKPLLAATGGQWGQLALLEMFVFVGILALGLAWIWAKGHLDWVKSTVQSPDFESKVPRHLYEQVNERALSVQNKTAGGAAVSQSPSPTSYRQP
ncbi:MAG: NADH-quinone oxidoreductase subunit A [Microscillaceae bacterium]|nr:NADH-quinone oxidoreductase subunit A [Microscillaceae bacterium]